MASLNLESIDRFTQRTKIFVLPKTEHKENNWFGLTFSYKYE